MPSPEEPPQKAQTTLFSTILRVWDPENNLGVHRAKTVGASAVGVTLLLTYLRKDFLLE